MHRLVVRLRALREQPELAQWEHEAFRIDDRISSVPKRELEPVATRFPSPRSYPRVSAALGFRRHHVGAHIRSSGRPSISTRTSARRTNLVTLSRCSSTETSRMTRWTPLLSLYENVSFRFESDNVLRRVDADQTVDVLLGYLLAKA